MDKNEDALAGAGGRLTSMSVPKTQVTRQTEQPKKAKRPFEDLPSRGTAIELCCGMGGMGIGLRELGFDVKRAYDLWDEAVAIYNHNFGESAAAVCNLVTAKGRALVQTGCAGLGEIELLAAGPPCKGFSQLRNGFHDGRNGHNRVLRAMPSYVAMLKPRMFLIENVPALLTHRTGKTFNAVLHKLRSPAPGLVYRLQYGVYDAATYGTPQARKRVLIFGVRRDDGTERLPEPEQDLAALFAAIRHGSPVPEHLTKQSKALQDPKHMALTSSRQALSDLPVLGAGAREPTQVYATKPKSTYQRWARQGAGKVLHDTQTPAITPNTLERLQQVPAGGCARKIPKEHLNGLARRFDSAYRRLHPDAPSTALSTKYDCVYHFDQERSLSVREYARLQGIPDRITFPQTIAPRRSAYEMIGNSVPPLLIKHVLGLALEAGEETPDDAGPRR